jgi:hypothetical protein
MATEHAVTEVLALCGSFVVKKKGVWNHDDWESLVADAVKLGVPATDEGKRGLGNILEAAKGLYSALPTSASPAKPKAAAKPKATAKPKAAAKPKAKA